MQLVAYGAQDVYLTGNPQITFFKVVYRRHTNFSMELIKQTLNGDLSSGSSNSASCTISRNGDLVHDMYIQIHGKGGNEVFENNVNKTHRSIKEVSIEIGGQLIDRQSGEFMQLYSDLVESNPSGNPCGVNKFHRLSGNGWTPSWDSIKHGDHYFSYYVPLRFWFCRNPGLALPLIALQYHEVRCNILIDNTQLKLQQGGDVDLWANYIYLDTDERRRFAQVSHEYLIEQVQKQTFNVDNSTQNFNLHFNHPVKELQWIFVAKDEDLDSFCEPVLSETTLVGGDVDNCNVILKLNGQDRFQEQKLGFFADYQKYKYHTGTGNLCNLDGDLDLNISTLEYVIQNMKDGDNSTKLGHTQLASSMGSVGGKSPDDHPNKVNDDMITEITGAISKSAKCPVYTYSFALKPEEHQPSGTCNFSRIDSSSLNFSGMNGAATAKQNIKLFVYAVNYNVLRVMSGMGGLAYSN
jgi:hypothetical protein